MRLAILSLFMCLGCATTSTTLAKAKAEIVADATQCKPETTEAVHNLLPQAAVYAVCLALNSSDASKCQPQEQALLKAGEADAIACGLAALQKANDDAVAAAGK